MSGTMASKRTTSGEAIICPPSKACISTASSMINQVPIRGMSPFNCDPGSITGIFRTAHTVAALSQALLARAMADRERQSRDEEVFDTDLRRTRRISAGTPSEPGGIETSTLLSTG